MEAATLIARAKSRLPDAFLDAVEGMSGDELFDIFAAIFARVSKRRVDAGRARLIRDATGPENATGTLTIHFAEPTGSDGYEIVTMVGDEPERQPIVQTGWGVRLVLVDPLVRDPDEAAGDVEVAVEAERAGWDGNVRGDTVNAWAIADVNNIDSLVFSVGSSEDAREEFLAGVRNGTITFTASEMTGGRAGTLDLKARGRGMPRALGESDEALRRRLRAPPDAVTPGGIVRAVNKALGYDGASYTEYWDDGFAFGISGFGEDAFAGVRSAAVLVPAGSDIEALQALVGRIKAAGYYVAVVEGV